MIRVRVIGKRGMPDSSMGNGVRPDRVIPCQKTSEIMKLNRIPWFPAFVVVGVLIRSAFAAEEKETAKPSDKTAAGESATKPKTRIQEMSEELKLSDDQRTKLRPIFQEEAKKLREIRQDTSLEKDQRAVKIKAIRTDYSGKIKQILTADQNTTCEKSRADRAGRPQGKGGDANRPKRHRDGKGGAKKSAKE